MKNTKKILMVALAFVMLLSLAGCGGSDKKDAGVVGTWEYKDSSGYVYQFNEDMTGNYSVVGDFTYTDDGEIIVITYTKVENEAFKGSVF